MCSFINSPSPSNRKVPNLCYKFSQSIDIIFLLTLNVWYLQQNRFKLYCPAVYLNGNINHVEKNI